LWASLARSQTAGERGGTQGGEYMEISAGRPKSEDRSPKQEDKRQKLKGLRRKAKNEIIFVGL